MSNIQRADRGTAEQHFGLFLKYIGPFLGTDRQTRTQTSVSASSSIFSVNLLGSHKNMRETFLMQRVIKIGSCQWWEMWQTCHESAIHQWPVYTQLNS